MVIRDPRVHTMESELIFEGQTTTTTESTRNETEEAIAVDANGTPFNDLIVVDDDTGRPKGAGTFEDPRKSITGGVKIADPDKNRVYVIAQENGDAYKEAVVIKEGLEVFSTYYEVFGVDRMLPFGEKPLVDGGSQGPTFTMLDDSKLRGFEIMNTDLGGAPQIVALDHGAIIRPYDVSRAGIFAENATVTIEDVDVHDTSYGTLILNAEPAPRSTSSTPPTRTTMPPPC